MKSRIQKSVSILSATFALALPLQAANFTDDFESGLAQWTGKSGGGHSGLLVADPLGSGRGNVLTFSSFGYGGDLFSSLTISNSGSVVVSFDYLGLADAHSLPGDLGGFFGIATSLTPVNEGHDIIWYAGTVDSYPSLLTTLTDDGLWHRYQFAVDGDALGAFRLTMEDFVGSAGSPCDVYFDNISVMAITNQVPEPTAATLGLLGGLATLVMLRRRH